MSDRSAKSEPAAGAVAAAHDIIPVPDTPEFKALQDAVFSAVDRLLAPGVEHVTMGHVTAALSRQGIHLTDGTLDAVIDSMESDSGDGGPQRLRGSEIRTPRRPDELGRPFRVFTRGRR